MSADLSPIVNTVIGLAATGIGIFGSMALAALAKRCNIQVSAGQTAAFDAALNKAITFGAATLQTEIAAKGWNHPDVQNAVLSQALTTMADRFPDALAGVGLSPDLSDPRNARIISNALTRALPAAFTAAAASPATPSPASPITPPAA
jgi:hypothetical protein